MSGSRIGTNLVAEQGSMVFTWDECDVIRITHTASDAYKSSLARKGQALDPNVLSPRELEVLGCVVAGDTNEEAGVRLDIGAQTVKFHIANLMRKLGAKNRVAVAVLAVRGGLVP